MKGRGSVQLGLILLLAIFSSILVSGIWLMKDLQRDMETLRNEIKSANELHTQRAEALQQKISSVLYRVDPWSRCLRFRHTRNCTLGSAGPDDPPCTADILKHMLDSLTDTFDVLEVDHFITYGTLLGAVREQRIIPWTADVDVMIVKEEEFPTIPTWLKDYPALSDMGYHYFIESPSKLARMCIENAPGKPLYNKYKRWMITDYDFEERYYHVYPYADIYVNQKSGSAYKSPYGPPCPVSGKVLFPLSKVKMYDREYSAPHNVTRFLWRSYGADFMLPPSQQSIHGSWTEACTIRSDADIRRLKEAQKEKDEKKNNEVQLQEFN